MKQWISKGWLKDYTSLLCLPSGSEALLYHLSELKGMALWKQKYESLGLDASGIEGTVVHVLLTHSDFSFESLIIMVILFCRGYYCCWFFHPESKWATSVSIKSEEFKKRACWVWGKGKHVSGSRGGWESKPPLLVVSFYLVSLHLIGSYHKNSLTWKVALGIFRKIYSACRPFCSKDGT